MLKTPIGIDPKMRGMCIFDHKNSVNVNISQLVGEYNTLAARVVELEKQIEEPSLQKAKRLNAITKEYLKAMTASNEPIRQLLADIKNNMPKTEETE